MKAILTRGKLTSLIAFFAVVLAPSLVFAQSSQQVDDLQRRIKRLEAEMSEFIREKSTRIEELEQQLIESEVAETEKSVVTAFDALQLDIGGFLNQTYSHNIGGDSPQSGSFDQTNFEMLISAELTERDRFFTALGFLRESQLANENTAEDVSQRDWDPHNVATPAIILWWNHTFSEALDVTVGRFINPWGIINIEHFPPVLMNLRQPQFLRPFPGSTIIPNFMNGIQLHGRQYISEHELEYYAYSANFVGSPTEMLWGGRLAWTVPSRAFTVGTSYNAGDKDNEGFDGYNAFGADLFIDYEGFGLKSELIYNMVDGDAGDQESWYVQPFYSWEDWVFFYRYDFIDLDDNLSSDASEQTEHIIGVNYFYTPTIRLRAEYVFNIYELEQDSLGQDRDFDQIQFSATVSL